MPDESSGSGGKSPVEEGFGSTRRSDAKTKKPGSESFYEKIPYSLRAVFAVVFLVGAVLLIGSYTFLPSLVASLVARDIKERTGIEGEPEVSLESDPPPGMLLGRFESGTVTVPGPDLGDVRPDEVTIDLDSFDLNVFQSIINGRFTADGPLSGSLRVELSEAEVARVAAERIEDIPINGIAFTEDRMRVRSGTQVLGVDVPLSVRGPLLVDDGGVVFDPQNVAAFGVRVPQRITDRLLANADFEYPVKDLPFDGEITDIEIQDGRLLVFGEVTRLSLN